MTPEELLKPRIKVEKDYPFSIYKVGAVLDMGFAHLHSTTNAIKTFIKYPHIFRLMEWWEERKESDMPEYLKKVSEEIDAVKNGEIINLDSFKWWGFINNKSTWKYFLPATKEEYEKQKQ